MAQNSLNLATHTQNRLIVILNEMSKKNSLTFKNED